MTLFGIDAEGAITKWPGPKYSFGIFRAVREGGLVDTDYARNVRVTEAAGAIAGGYHYIGHGRPIRDDVKRFVDAMGDPRGRFVVADVEDAGLTWTELSTWFDEYRRHHPDQPVVIYSYRTYWLNRFGTRKGTIFTPYLWSANPRTDLYAGDQSYGWEYDFGGWSGPDIWQYHGTMSLGIGASVDLNAFRGTISDLRKLTGLVPPDSSTGDNMAQINDTDASPAPKLVDLAVGVQIYALANPPAPLVKVVSGGSGLYSPFTNGNYRAVIFSTGGVRQMGLVLAADCDNIRDLAGPVPVDVTPFDQADIDAATAPLQADIVALRLQVASNAEELSLFLTLKDALRRALA